MWISNGNVSVNIDGAKLVRVWHEKNHSWLQVDFGNSLGKYCVDFDCESLEAAKELMKLLMFKTGAYICIQISECVSKEEVENLKLCHGYPVSEEHSNAS